MDFQQRCRIAEITGSPLSRSPTSAWISDSKLWCFVREYLLWQEDNMNNIRINFLNFLTALDIVRRLPN